MDYLIDYKQFAILYVDDEEKSLKMFARAFGDQFRILTAATAQAGLELLRRHSAEIAILLTDQRMPGEKGVWLLEKARELEPRILRILVTAYADMDAAIEAVNSGAIYKYLHKPWDPPDLIALLKRALEFYVVQRERDQLFAEKMAMIRNMLIADRILSLGLLAAGMSHHIRNALVPVRTFIELAPDKVRREATDPTRQIESDFWVNLHQQALAGIDKINGMLRDLWTASEKPDQEFGDAVSLAPIVCALLEKYRPQLEARQLEVQNHVPETLPRLLVDRKKFRRLFELLLEDEIGFLPAGSRIVFSAGLIEANGTDPEIKIEIRDNGPGLPADVLRTIFDPFSPRSEMASEYGIRLMACFFIVHYHRGRIVAQSAENKGTTFVLQIPVNPRTRPLTEESQMFLHKVQLNDEVWGQLLANG